METPAQPSMPPPPDRRRGPAPGTSGPAFPPMPPPGPSELPPDGLDRGTWWSRWHPTAAQWAVAGLALALGVAAFFYRLLHWGQLEQTAALFVGLPTILAVTLALTPRARSATGMAVKGTAIALFLSGIVFGEGFVCILMASPLFFLVAVLIGVAVDSSRGRSGRVRVLVAVPLLLMLLSTEGVSQATSFPREEVVEVTRTVPGDAGAVERALAVPPRLGRPLPVYLRLGFPRPVTATGSGLAPGSRRTIRFTRHARHFRRHDSTLVMEVVRSRPGSLTFRAVSDTTPVASWLEWQEAEVTWSEIQPGRTSVRWVLRYRRRLDPAWYFGPWERYAARLAAGYLIEVAATPAFRSVS